VAGLDEPSSGTLTIGGESMEGVPVRERDVALISQEHALYPYLTVERNLRFPLEMRKTPREEADRRVAAESRVLRLSRLMGRLPAQLSAGHRQTVALGRATTRAPRLFLMDEPLSALDAAERPRVRAELRRFLNGMGTTTLYATNDQAEAMLLADRVAVLDSGRLRQVGTPSQLLEQPVDLFVAGFFGLPPMQFAAAVVEEQGGLGWFRLAGQRLRVPGGLPGPLRARAGSQVVLGARPHQVTPPAAAAHLPVDARLSGTVARVERLGAEDLVYLAVDGATLCARFPPRTSPARGDTAEVAVDTASLQVFDPVSGVALWHGRPSPA
jgi:multiple sugar transport system ATP-binding protein